MTDDLQRNTSIQIEDLRAGLTSYAYNILGSIEEARDVVHDSLLQYMTMDVSHVENAGGYLSRMVINRSINQKNRQKRLLRNYPGEWLPEPVATERADTGLNRRDILSYSLMVLLEKLNARQRAVFILKEAFEYEHTEIAEVLGITEENSRQLLSRAKRHLQQSNLNISKRKTEDTLEKYLQIIQLGDLQRLEKLLTEDISVVSDGGGKASAALNPIVGKPFASLFLNGLFSKFYKEKPICKGIINHQPALFYFEGSTLTACQIFTFDHGLLRNVFIMRNPDKLKALQKEI